MLVTEIDNSQRRIYKFLQKHDMDFSPALSKRVDLLEYSTKLSINGCNVFLVDEKDSGHACFYLDSLTKTAFLTSLCIGQYLTGTGVSIKFLNLVELLAKKNGATKMELEVSPSNERAKKFYKNNGYQYSKDFHQHESLTSMHKVLS